jgi:hypothetical protein
MRAGSPFASGGGEKAEREGMGRAPIPSLSASLHNQLISILEDGNESENRGMGRTTILSFSGDSRNEVVLFEAWGAAGDVPAR